MNKIKFFLIATIFLLNSCQGVKDALEGKRRSKSGDEFLVEKKNPLVLPPEFNQLPKPGSTQDNNENESSSFEISIKDNNNSDEKNQQASESNSTQEFILKNIKKNESD